MLVSSDSVAARGSSDSVAARGSGEGVVLTPRQKGDALAKLPTRQQESVRQLMAKADFPVELVEDV